MSFDQLPTELMQEIATFSLAGEMKSVNKELRQSSLSQRVIDRRRSHMESLAKNWDSSTEVSEVMESLGKKGNADDVLHIQFQRFSVIS